MAAGLADVVRRDLDGIVCGHIHRAALRMQAGHLYANTGDWVESLTALRETQSGALQLVNHHGDVLAELAPQPHAAQQRAA
ncbi:hypothetical protein XAC301_09090 [Xanthomonas arboricola pv. corylina]|uniref:Calcineurin-like phosphoesterase domain-containing protein n=1 Tax=Xanthomonas arboricola pv. corylina TaxID=487821 RepID=A0A8D6Y0A6_9XANT|nr:hypothetical protein XAC301_09090 [Xanthomonas arboricola pv. corylina]CAE6720503.1 hypothetical protein XAC301_09090 [Xanthomonas arboricola pv. corylina]CAE6720960.1 hypothetical protein CFBP1159_09230 [Xanthomonas arboricola pv. corylina]CAE6720985.1 hypothetical protein CFBP1159_09230 [Xanthomonas arboricola pv. corylina]